MSSPPSSPTPPKGSVRSMISIFENQTVYVNNEPTNLVRRARSMVNLSYTRPIKKTIERIEPENNLELTQIEQQIQHLQNKLSTNYKTYSRENHIYYQNQIIFILTDLANVETRSNPKTVDRKSELTEVLKRLNKKLNVLLPSESHEEKTSKYDKFGMRSKSIDEDKREVKTNRKEPVVKQQSEERVESVKINKKEPVVKQKSEEHEETVKLVIQQNQEREQEDDVDSSSVSVRYLKQLFEKNTNENEGKTEFGVTKISRKFLTFNSKSDLKYVPYSERFKTQELEVNGKEGLVKQNSEDTESSFELTRTVWKVTPASDDEALEEKQGVFTPDSLTNEESGSSSSSDSESEKTAKQDLEE